MTPNDNIPEEIQNEIIADAKRIKRTLIRKTDGDVIYIEGYGEGYVAGATAWAPWKVKYDELQATIDDKIDAALHAERNAIQAKMTEMETGYLKQIQSMIDTFQMIVNAPVPANEREYISWFVTAKNIAGGVISDWEAEKYVQQFKDGKGKEVQKPEPPLLLNTCGICKERPIGSGITVCDECYKNFDGDRRGFWNSETYQ